MNIFAAKEQRGNKKAEAGRLIIASVLVVQMKMKIQYQTTKTVFVLAKKIDSISTSIVKSNLVQFKKNKERKRWPDWILGSFFIVFSPQFEAGLGIIVKLGGVLS